MFLSKHRLNIALLRIGKHDIVKNIASLRKVNIAPYMQKAGDSCDISPQFFLDFPQNFRLRTRNQYCTQAIA